MVCVGPWDSVDRDKQTPAGCGRAEEDRDASRAKHRIEPRGAARRGRGQPTLFGEEMGVRFLLVFRRRSLNPINLMLHFSVMVCVLFQ